MFQRFLPLCILLNLLAAAIPAEIASSTGGDGEFTFDGFLGANLTLESAAAITADGVLRLTNATKILTSRALFPTPFIFRNFLVGAGNVSSFSSHFVFGIVPEFTDLSGHGIAFFFSPSDDPPGAIGSQYLGLFNPSNNGNRSNHIFAVELDTVQNPEFGDIDANHVGIDVNSMRSYNSSPAGYFSDDGNGVLKKNNLSLISGEPMQVWVEYDGLKQSLDITLAPINVPKPRIPLLSSTIDLSEIFFKQMHVGFSSSSDPFLTSHYILGWSFKVNGAAPPLNLSALPPIPRSIGTKESERKPLAIWLSVTSTVLALGTVAGGVALFIYRRMKFAEVIEEWESEYGPQRFPYKDLFRATNGFRDGGLLGAGGFGKVYRGILPESKIEVAVKRISHESRQGVKEFVAEITSMGRLRHRNLVQLLGYSRREKELLLVYDFMPNGSLDRFLFDRTRPPLPWSQRFRIIRGVASGLLYLHEEWEQVVVHRDIKSSNVLLDRDLNGRLGDFGLARLYDHGGDPHTTRVVGTMGYLAPELARAGKATTVTDVYAFGVFLLEVACGRRPIEPAEEEEEAVLVDWVVARYREGEIFGAADPRMGGEFLEAEVELVMKLGLLCCDPLPAERPSMRQVVQYLDGDVPLRQFSSNYLDRKVLSLLHNEAFEDYMMWYNNSTSVTVSSLSGCR